MEAEGESGDVAEYSISAARRAGGRVHLVRVHLEPSHFVLGEYGRRQILESHGRGDRWVTIRQEGSDWMTVDRVDLVDAGGVTYLRTDSRPVAGDDLGDLPGL